MDEIQKQIVGYLIMTVLAAFIGFLTAKIGLWIQDVSLVLMLGVVIGAVEIAAYRWIRYTYKIPEGE